VSILPRLLLIAGCVLPRAGLAQLPDSVPPEPPPGADLPALGAWMERWLPVVGFTRYSAVDSAADFYAHGTDSVITAKLEGCTLVLHERWISRGSDGPSEQQLAIHVPLDQVDTALVQPRIRQARLLISRPNLLLFGQLVLPLRNRARTEFITVFADDGSRDPALVREHLVPSVFAQVPAERSALVLRRAAAQCAASAEESRPGTSPAATPPVVRRSAAP
jgi:hypothetical protein